VQNTIINRCDSFVNAERCVKTAAALTLRAWCCDRYVQVLRGDAAREHAVQVIQPSHGPWIGETDLDAAPRGWKTRILQPSGAGENSQPSYLQ